MAAFTTLAASLGVTEQHPRVKLSCQIPEHPIEDRSYINGRDQWRPEYGSAAEIKDRRPEIFHKQNPELWNLKQELRVGDGLSRDVGGALVYFGAP